MRLTRRAFLASAALALTTAPAKPRPAAPSEPTPIDIQATPIASFSAADKDRRTFGSLTFRSGL